MFGVPDQGAADRRVASGGTSYSFAARDEAAAESMADALAASGFGEVAACPTRRRSLLERGMGWELAAFDGNRYPPGNIGLQQELAVERQARAVARAQGGFATGTTANYYELTLGTQIHPLPNDNIFQFLEIRPEIRGDASDRRVYDVSNSAGGEYSELTAAVDVIMQF